MRGDRAFAAWPTNDGLTLVICGLPMRDFEAAPAPPLRPPPPRRRGGERVAGEGRRATQPVLLAHCPRSTSSRPSQNAQRTALGVSPRVSQA